MKESENRSTLVLIMAVALLGMMGGSLMGPVLPAISGHFGVGGGRVGLVITFYAASTAVSFPFMGYLTDRYGRKHVLIPALIINGTAGILGATAPNFSFLLFARVIQGIGIAGMAPMALILIGDIYGGKERTAAMGKLSSTRSGGGMIAPLLGGALASLHWSFPFFIYALSIPLAVVLWIWFPFPGKTSKISVREYLKPLKEAGKDPRVQAVLLLNFLSFFLVYTVVTFIPQHLSREFGVSEALTGVFLAVQAVATITIALQSGRLAELTHKTYLVGIGFLISGFGFLLLPINGLLLWIAFSLLIFGLGRGFYQPQINTLVTEVAPAGRLGGVASVNNIAKYAGQMTAPIVLGVIMSYYGFSTVFLISGSIGVATGIGTFLWISSKFMDEDVS
ncbi:MAG: MFS transporter [Candidatus Thermoplasmatota archaeon]|nr:MFS transporter [Candidatus Thermoplasmatota archaeon]